jgi:hypothetical protein
MCFRLQKVSIRIEHHPLSSLLQLEKAFLLLKEFLSGKPNQEICRAHRPTSV